MLSETAKQNLYARAREVAKNSYSPYSDYPVGAAVLTESGDVYVGTNVENASYGLTICAEQTAICNAVSHGDRSIVAIAIHAERGAVKPCGACRQFIVEFGDEVEVIYIADAKLTSRSGKSLLPDSFTKKDVLNE